MQNPKVRPSLSTMERLVSICQLLELGIGFGVTGVLVRMAGPGLLILTFPLPSAAPIPRKKTVSHNVQREKCHPKMPASQSSSTHIHLSKLLKNFFSSKNRLKKIAFLVVSLLHLRRACRRLHPQQVVVPAAASCLMKYARQQQPTKNTCFTNLEREINAINELKTQIPHEVSLPRSSKKRTNQKKYNDLPPEAERNSSLLGIS